MRRRIARHYPQAPPRDSGERRVLKYLTAADDATHAAVVIEVEQAISGMDQAGVTDRLA
ncbi:hypothetical protein [Rhodanobacter sp. DHB23]|uniref:hypothetical protein n=1 Tax=Rhodanobacter sp. DHB23 TaxID=2775923 RepID=UPI00178579AD|nr:hypothetical protein [Rhodanobacter sp. DHB23]MBD8871819.1 hypothetical protein [Rhodanobacter sp. DHB23]